MDALRTDLQVDRVEVEELTLVGVDVVVDADAERFDLAHCRTANGARKVRGSSWHPIQSEADGRFIERAEVCSDAGPHPFKGFRESRDLNGRRATSNGRHRRRQTDEENKLGICRHRETRNTLVFQLLIGFYIFDVKYLDRHMYSSTRVYLDSS